MVTEKVLVVINGNGMKNKILYSAVVLDTKSRLKLFLLFNDLISSKGFKFFGHHMTIVFGKGLPKHLKDDLGKTVELRATKIGFSDMAIAVQVEGYESTNDIPHVTLAVNTEEGGTPAMSKDITKWVNLSSYINLKGIVNEVKSK